MSASAAYSSNQQSTQNIDRRLTTSAGDIFSLSDAEFSTGGGPLNLTVGSDEVAKAALATAAGVTDQASRIAAQVADSQRAFVETASGQKTIIYAVAAGAAVLILPKLLGK